MQLVRQKHRKKKLNIPLLTILRAFKHISWSSSAVRVEQIIARELDEALCLHTYLCQR